MTWLHLHWAELRGAEDFGGILKILGRDSGDDQNFWGQEVGDANFF